MNVDLDTIKTTAMWVLIGIAVVGILLAIIVKKIISKVISLVIAAVLVFLCWQQRDKVLNYADHLKDGACSTATGAAQKDMPSFFGIQVTIPADWCEQQTPSTP